jgi:Family of unknown function (DUF5995)
MRSDPLRPAPVASIAEAIERMRAIDERLPPDDGLKWFNRLYLHVTVAMGEALGTTTFRDPAFVTVLDIAFANLYFQALARADDGAAHAPAAWRPVLAARADRRIARLQFALAGMNAHINRDLPVGIVEAFQVVGGNPLHDEARHDDFQRVDDQLARIEETAKRDVSLGLIEVVDTLAGSADDQLAMWNVKAARAAAWTNAQVLWALQTTPALRASFFDRLDRLAGFAGRGLLAPTHVLRPHPNKDDGRAG